jgi:hypothetical protein
VHEEANPIDSDDRADQLEADEPTRVIFSLSVNSETPIAALHDFPARTRAPRPNDDFYYDVYHADFEDSNWDSRAQSLDSAVNAALDLLDASGVAKSEFESSDAAVRAFFTFDPGAETITAGVVKRLAEYNATIWIDANS